MAEARAAAIDDLADDILRDVFARLPGFQDLLRCAATCKRWRQLLTDPVFLRRLGIWPGTARRPSALVGIFYQQHCHSLTKREPSRRKPDSPPQFLNLQAGDGHLSFDSFVDNGDGLFNLARPMASRRGLLLVRLMLPTPADDYCCDRFHMAVCRPLIGKGGTRLLPPHPPRPPEANTFCYISGCALLTDEDYGVIGDDSENHQRRQQHAFQVLLAYTDCDKCVYVCTYSSATDTWSVPVKCRGVSGLARCGPFSGTVAHGIVHWMYLDAANFYTLNVSITTAHVSLTKTPIKVHAGSEWRRVPFPCIAGDGSLSFVSMRDDGVLEIWTKQGQHDDDHGHKASEEFEGWLRSNLINLGSNKDLVLFAETRGAMLVELDGAFFTIDLESKEKASVDVKDKRIDARAIHNLPHLCSTSWCTGCVQHWASRVCKHNTPVLCEVDWVFDRRM